VVPPSDYGSRAQADHRTTNLIHMTRGSVVPFVPRVPHAEPAVAAIALAVLVSACGSHSAPPTHSASTPRHSGTTRVTISGYAYQPTKITAAPGTKITFTNHDQTAHTATSKKTGFDSGTIKPGKSATITVGKPGTYTYYCQFHAFMHATITVK
jgi:plastocyanin